MRTSSKLGLFAVTAAVVALGLAPTARAEGAGQYIDDAAVTTKVKASLLSDSMLKASDVSVETTQGVVQLSGSVNSKEQEAEAVKNTNQVSGVKSVKDLLVVKPSQSE